MKTIRLLAILLLVALGMGISSCSEELEKNPHDEPIDELIDDTGDAFYQYGLNWKDYECGDSQYDTFNQNINNFSGLKNSHLWISSYNRTTKEKLLEWTDSRTFDRKRTVHLGYGEYKDIEISSIIPLRVCIKNNFFVAGLHYVGESYRENNILFKTAAGTLKEIKNTAPQYIIDWYKESVFVGNCCYNDMGDTIYVSPDIFGLTDGVAVSYEEVVSVKYDYKPQYVLASRKNYKFGQSVWNTEYKLPFEVFRDTKKELILLDNSTNIWKYKLDLLYYDGTKKDYTFYLNIDNGTISETLNTSPLIGKWLYTTEAGNKEIITFNTDGTGS